MLSIVWPNTFAAPVTDTLLKSLAPAVNPDSVVAPNTLKLLCNCAVLVTFTVRKVVNPVTPSVPDTIPVDNVVAPALTVDNAEIPITFKSPLTFVLLIDETVVAFIVPATPNPPLRINEPVVVEVEARELLILIFSAVKSPIIPTPPDTRRAPVVVLVD